MNSRLNKSLLGLSLFASLSACSGSDDDAKTNSDAGSMMSATLTCEIKQFADGTKAVVPTSAQLAPYAKTHMKGSATVVVSSSGGLTVNGKSITVASTCLVTEGSGEMLMLSWGNPQTVGAGNIVFESHIDFRSDGISGIADGTVL